MLSILIVSPNQEDLEAFASTLAEEEGRGIVLGRIRRPSPANGCGTFL